MSRLPVLSVDTAPAAARPLLEAAEVANGYVPNLLGILAHAPAALEGYLTVSGINAKSSLSIEEWEVVQITAAAVHGCGFCVAGHTAVAVRKTSLAPEVVDALRSLKTVPVQRLDALATFTKAVIARRGAVTDAELTGFKNAGFGDQPVLEVVLGVALATLCNFANNLGRPPLNPQLAAYRWSAQAT